MITLLTRIQKNDISELIYKREIDPQTCKTNVWLLNEKGRG